MNGNLTGQSCHAVTRTRHPDGETSACGHGGRNPRLDPSGVLSRYVWDAGAKRAEMLQCEGPVRMFLCDQHAAEHDAGLNVFDPERPTLKAHMRSLDRNAPQRGR